MSADTDAIAMAACPDCGAVQGVPCTYMPPRAYDYEDKQVRGWMSMRRQAQRAGTPTKQAHQGRYRAARDIQNKAARKAAREQYTPRPMSSVLRTKGALDPDRYPEPLATYLAAVAFDHHGYSRLREWLAEHGGIFADGR